MAASNDLSVIHMATTSIGVWTTIDSGLSWGQGATSTTTPFTHVACSHEGKYVLLICHGDSSCPQQTFVSHDYGVIYKATIAGGDVSAVGNGIIPMQ